jgi:hypothetical protein
MLFKVKLGTNSKTNPLIELSENLQKKLPKLAKFWSPEQYEWKHDQRGFNYRLYMDHLNRVIAETDTDFQDWIMYVHFIAMKTTPCLLMNLKSARGISNITRMAFNINRFKWTSIATYRRLINFLTKFYKQNALNNEVEVKKMSIENKDVMSMFNWNVDAGKTYNKISEAFADLTTLTITTNGKQDSNGKPITFMKTEIKLLTGDITSDTPFEGEKLETYHKTMFDLSLNITKTYSQIVIQLLSILLPWSGLAIPKEALTQINDLAKDMFKTEKSGT